MRIALVGSHGTGKTTLAKELARMLNLPEIKEVARDEIKKAGYKTTAEFRQAPMAAIIAIQDKILIEQMKKEVELRNFVSDRSVIDIAAYTQYYTGNTNKQNILNWAEGSYDVIIYVPIMFMLHGDGFRDEDVEFQWAIDGIIREYLAETTAPIYKICTDNIAGRMQEMKMLFKAVVKR